MTNGFNFTNFKPYFQNTDIFLEFCKIGEKTDLSKSDYIRIGEFNQTFGFFSNPNNTLCPVLESPYGILHATKETILMDLENTYPVSAVLKGEPPFDIDQNKDGRIAFCVYVPKNGVKN